MSAVLRRPVSAAMSSASSSVSTATTAVASSASETPPRDSQTCTLPDGRVLGYAEYGDPRGRPLLYFHGFPTCRLEGRIADDVGRRLGLRVLALDRPGYGLSTPQPGRRIVDWPADVQAFARQQRLAAFGVLGVSGGGPYALACARALPPGLLTGVGLFAGAGPFVCETMDGAARAAIPWRSRWAGWMAAHWPWGLRVLLTGVVGVLRWLAHTQLAARHIDRYLETVARKRQEKRERAREAGRKETEPADTADSKTLPEQRRDVLRAIFGAFDQGLQATVDEAYLLSHDWGFRFEEITFDPIRMWHGDQDANVPLAWIQPMVRGLPHAELKVYEGKTHYTLVKDLEEILGTFVETTAGEEGRERARDLTAMTDAEMNAETEKEC